MIGHTKYAAGLADSSRACWPCIIGYSADLGVTAQRSELGRSPLYLNTEARPWMRPIDGGYAARRQRVWFGGTNFHAVLEEYVPANERPIDPAIERWPAELLLWRARSPAE